MPEFNDILEDLWNSSADLTNRFGVEPSSQHAMRIFKEEVREFEDEFNFASLLDSRLSELSEEAGDVIVTVIQALRSHNVSFDTFSNALYKVMQKNDGKTPETHYVEHLTGKIRRKGNE